MVYLVFSVTSAIIKKCKLHVVLDRPQPKTIQVPFLLSPELDKVPMAAITNCHNWVAKNS